MYDAEKAKKLIARLDRAIEELETFTVELRALKVAIREEKAATMRAAS